MTQTRLEPKHPAKFSPAVLAAAKRLIMEEAQRSGHPSESMMLLDPFAGTGRCHEMPCMTWGVELEPEWGMMNPRTVIGDARQMDWWEDDTFDIVFTSPSYGNRLADHHDAHDGSTRHSYTHDLGRKLTEGNSGVMPFRNDQPTWAPYRTLHREVWNEVTRVLEPAGLFLLNCSNFIAGGVEQMVTEWHIGVLVRLGYTVEKNETVPTPRLRFGANRERIDGESLIALRAPS